MNIKVSFLKESFAIAKIKECPAELFNALMKKNKFLMFCTDEEENSLICEESSLPEFLECSKNWSALKILGPLPFDQWGILSELLKPLAALKCSVLAISSFSSDYIFFPSEKLEIIKKTISEIAEIV